MRSASRLHGLALALCFHAATTSGCGPAPEPAQPAPLPPPAVSVEPQASAPLPAPPPPPRVQAKATVWDALPAKPPAFAWVDAKALRGSRLWPTVTDALSKLGVGKDIDAVGKKCGLSPLEAADEVLVAGDPGKGNPEPFVVARGGVGPEALVACAAALSGPSEPVDLEGAKGAELGLGFVAVSAEGMLLFGPRIAVVMAMKRLSERGPSPAAPLAPLEPGTLAVFAGPLPGSPFRRGEGSLSLPQGAPRLALSLEAASEADASALAAKARDTLSHLTDSLADKKKGKELKPDAERVASAVSVRSEGSAVKVVTEVKGDEAAFARSLQALAQAGLERYQLAAKTAEAKATLGVLAIYLSAYTEREEVDAKGKVKPKSLPPSAPRSPARVPKGTAEPVTDATFAHPTWKALHFTPPGPTRYSYSITTTRGGKKAVARAEGDLNGDGKLSRFEIEVEILPDGTTRRSPLKEIDPLE